MLTMLLFSHLNTKLKKIYLSQGKQSRSHMALLYFLYNEYSKTIEITMEIYITSFHRMTAGY